MIEVISWMAAVIAVAGAVLNTRSKWQGFVLWLASNGFWCGYNAIGDEWPQAVLFGAFWLLSLYGIFEGRKIQKINTDYKNTAENFEKEKARYMEMTGKQLSLLLEENTYLRRVLQGEPFHKRAKKRLRINKKQNTGCGAQDSGCRI